MTETAEIAVLGAGVIGLAIALRLSAEGKEVVLLDPNEPGSGASYGNAGTLAEYGCVPVGNPSVLRSLPQLLLDADSPFAMRWAALPQLLPWLLRFVRQSLPAPTRRNTVALAGLLKDALPAWHDIAAEAGAANLLRANGCLYLYRKQADFDGSAWSRELRTEMGIHQEILSPAEIAALEPNLPPVEGRGLFFPDSMNVTDPAVMMQRLFDAATSKGANFRRVAATSLEPGRDSVRVSGNGIDLTAKTVIVAAGAHSAGLALQAGDRIPLETERGYHLEFPMDAPLLTRPVCPIDLGFYMTPLAGRLRAAGTVELGGLQAPPNPARLALIERGVRQFFPNLTPARSQWLGFRPSLPDSRPVIGPSRSWPRVIYAFGHGHLGLTLAAVTARLVAKFVAVENDDAERTFGSTRF